MESALYAQDYIDIKNISENISGASVGFKMLFHNSNLLVIGHIIYRFYVDFDPLLYLGHAISNRSL